MCLCILRHSVLSKQSSTLTLQHCWFILLIFQAKHSYSGWGPLFYDLHRLQKVSELSERYLPSQAAAKKALFTLNYFSCSPSGSGLAISVPSEHKDRHISVGQIMPLNLSRTERNLKSLIWVTGTPRCLNTGVFLSPRKQKQARDFWGQSLSKCEGMAAWFIVL